MEHHIGIGDMAISDKENDILKTYALASCVAVTVYSSVKKVAGMVHVALPKPPEKPLLNEKASYYATTGVPLLINRMCKEFGCKKYELQVRLYGGAESINDEDVFRIGERNIAEVKRTLAGMNLNVHKAELGGKYSRTLVMDVAAGDVKVHYNPIKI